MNVAVAEGQSLKAVPEARRAHIACPHMATTVTSSRWHAHICVSTHCTLAALASRRKGSEMHTMAAVDR